MRRALPLAGDPAKVGDRPGAASVYDVNSVELISIIKRLNGGFTQAGKSIKTPTGFVSGCTFNPNARNLDAQVNRLERKIAAGAQFAMTQPVFEVRLLEEMVRRTAHIPIPIFAGVWPLLSGRWAEFLHNEVPWHTCSRLCARRDGRPRRRSESRPWNQVGEGDRECRARMFPGGLFDHAISAIRDNRRARRICAGRLKR